VTLYSQIFVLVLITDDAHMDLMRWNTAAAFPSLQLTSVELYVAIICEYAAEVGKPVHVFSVLLVGGQWGCYLVTAHLHGLCFL